MADEAPVDNTTVALAAMAEVEATRRMVVKFIFFSFWLFLAGIMAVVAWRGWSMPPSADSLYSQIFIVISTAMTGVTGFYLGSSYGSALKDMVGRAMPKPPTP